MNSSCISLDVIDYCFRKYYYYSNLAVSKDEQYFYLTFISCANCCEKEMVRGSFILSLIVLDAATRLVRASPYKKHTVENYPQQSLFNLYICKQWREALI